MPQVARLATAENVEFIPCERPFSNFDFVEKRKFSGIPPLRRILSQARVHKAQTIVIEEPLRDASDLLEEEEDIRKWRPDFQSKNVRSCRLSFFRDAISSSSIKSVPDGSLIGYAIYRQDAIKARVHESVMVTSPRENHFVRGAPSWTCAIAGRQFPITGYMYAQQNTVTNSCAHVAVRTVAGRFLRGDLSYRQMNEWVSQYRRARSIVEVPPSDGLTSDEMCHILQQAGANTLVGDYRRTERPPVPYQLRLYSSIESGFPGIVFFGTERNAPGGGRAYHVIPVFGHTFNEDTWTSGAELLYFPLRKATKCLTSGAWVSMFLGHDDNAGSNFCIPQHYMEPNRFCRDEHGNAILDQHGHPTSCRQQGGSVAYTISTLPAGIDSDPIEAEAIGADYLLAILREVPGNFPGWLERWQKRLAQKGAGEILVRPPEGMVLRTTFLTGSEYCRHLSAVRGWDRTKRIPDWITEVLSPISDDPFWIVEVSLPELFSANRRKVGEVLIRADRRPSVDRDAGSFLLARLPGCFVLLEPSGSKAAQGDRPTFCYIPVDIYDHVELIGCEDRFPTDLPVDRLGRLRSFCGAVSRVFRGFVK